MSSIRWLKILKIAMALEDITPGTSTNEEYPIPKYYGNSGHKYNYSHLLTPLQQQQGYEIILIDNLQDKSPLIGVHLYWQKHSIGSVIGYVLANNKLEPHSHLDKDYRGKGFGAKMYEALYSYAKTKNIANIQGGQHSFQASNVHQKLIQKHQLPGYKPEVDLPNGREMLGTYEYSLNTDPTFKPDPELLKRIKERQDRIKAREDRIKVLDEEHWKAEQERRNAKTTPEYNRALRKIDSINDEIRELVKGKY